MKKYELTNETITIDNIKTLYRIRALMDIEAYGVKIGDLGGYIEKEENLSHSGDAWVCGDSMVYGDARVFGNVKIYGDARVYDNAKVFGDAWVGDDAKVFGDAWVFGYAGVCGVTRVFDNAWVSGEARVYDNVWVFGDSWVGGNAMICGNADVFGHSKVFGYVNVRGDAGIGGDAEINKSSHILTIGPIGSREDTTTFFRTKENIIKVVCGCFYGTIDEFLAKVELTHGDNKYGQVYRISAELAKAQIELE